MTSAVSRETAIGVGVTALSVAAMAVDHLMGDDAPILEDPLTFVVSSVLCVALAAFLFGRLVPATRVAPDTAATRAIVLSGVAVVGAPLLFWLGLPLVLAGGGIALGLLESTRRRLAATAIVLGLLVIALGAIGYAVQLVDKLA